MNGAAANRITNAEEGFPEPLEFLEPFRVEGDAFAGLYAYFARQLDMGDEQSVRAYAAERTLSTPDQSDYKILLQSTLEMRHGKANKPACKGYYEELDASINYLQYRLALGLMGPAIDIALAKTHPDHTRVRAHRTIVAVNLVRDWVLENFRDETAAKRVTGLMDMDAEQHVKRFFNGEYDGSDEALVDRYLTSGDLPPHTAKTDDGWQRFEIKDYTARIIYSEGRKLIGPEELDDILARPKAPKSRTLRAVPDAEPAEEPPLTDLEKLRINDQVARLALTGVGIIPELRGRIRPDINLNTDDIQATDKILPAGRIAGRGIALLVATGLLDAIEQKYASRPSAKRKPKVPPADTVIVMDRLRGMVAHYDRSGLPVDAVLKLAEEAYRSVYGDEPTRRDFWLV